MSYTKNQHENYNRDRDITCARLGISVNDYNYLRRIGQQLHRIYEWSCNGVDDNGNEMTDERFSDYTLPLYNKAYAKCKILKLHIFYQSDPRGATIYVSKDPIESNNYNRLGSECIY